MLDSMQFFLKPCIVLHFQDNFDRGNSLTSKGMTLSYMGGCSFLPKTVAEKAMPSIMATGVSARRSVTSPIAYILGTLCKHNTWKGFQYWYALHTTSTWFVQMH